jgi:hypothetical protein
VLKGNSPIDTKKEEEAMYARLTFSTIQLDKLDKAIELNQDSILPAAKKQKGFKGYFGLSDSHTGKSITISLSDTEADMTAAEGSGYYREQLAKAAPLLSGQATPEHYEVTVRG